MAGFLAAVSPKTRPGLGGPDLRHSYASLLIAQGDHPRLIAEQLGHASVQITLDRHGHLMPGSYDHAGDRLEAALFGFAGPPA